MNLNNKLINYSIMCTLIILFSTSLAYGIFNKAKITIKVVDENNNSIEGANVGIGFDDYRSYTKENSVSGISDSEGIFTGSAPCTGYLGFNVTKDGFYKSIGHHIFKDKDISDLLPWDQELRVVLRRIENPVPMYARDTKESIIEIPVVEKNVGFDFTKFDWVTPYGKGKNADFVFHLKRQVVDRENFDATLTILFSNKYDGIQGYKEELKDGSLFKLPRYAPEQGYQEKLVLREWRNPGDFNVKRNFDFLAKDVNYIFRVRSIEEDNKFIRAMYGKILGFIDFSAVHSKTAKIYFKYYLNPDYTRNLEFDPSRNLFLNLPPLDRVGIQ
jgi:hypothetical protein